jgi:hypothetical protein
MTTDDDEVDELDFSKINLKEWFTGYNQETKNALDDFDTMWETESGEGEDDEDESEDADEDPDEDEEDDKAK